MQVADLVLRPGGVLRLARNHAGGDAGLVVMLAVVLPNLLFVLLSPWFLIRRALSPLVYLLAAIVALLLPWPLAFPVFLIAAAVDALFIVAFMFDMPFDTGLRSLQHLGDIDILASALYAAALAYFAVVAIALAVLFKRQRQRLRNATLVPALIAAALVGAFDYAVNGFKPIMRPEFESALASSGLDASAIIARDRDLLIVMVEGMGAYADPRERDILAGRLRDAAGERFAFSTGTVNHYGSTTGAESRELCGKWETFTYYLAHGDQDCLPRRLAEAGYRTASYHGSYGELFSRPVWYPRIGFEEMNFREDIERDRPDAITGYCGSVFEGLCDADIGEVVHADLLARDGGNKLLYWLTLNSHLPYATNPDNPLDCGTPQALIASRVPCDLTGIWLQVFDKVAEIAADPATPPVDILVVGDHNTPMWSREAYGHFVNGKVDWYLLKDLRGSSPKPASHAAASG